MIYRLHGGAQWRAARCRHILDRPVTTLLQTDHAPARPRDRARRAAAAAATSPNPLVGAVVVRDGAGAGRGLPRRLRRPARRARGARRLRRRRPARRDALRLARAVLPPRAARRRAPTRSSRPASRASSSPPTTRPRRPSGRGLGHPARRGRSRSWSPTASSPRARALLNQPFRKHARTGRPQVLFKSAMTLDGKVATRTGDSKWISGEDSRRLAHHWRAERDAVVGRDRHRAGRRPAADRAHRRRRPPAAPDRLRLRGAPAARLPARARRAEVPLTVVVSRAASRAGHRRARGRRRRGDRRHRRERARRACARARPARRARASPRSCSRAARTWRARSSTPARSTRSALFVAPVVLGGSQRPRPARGRGRRADRRGDRARSRSTCERIGDDVLITARLREW